MQIAEVLRNAASAGGTPAFAAPNADLTSERSAHRRPFLTPNWTSAPFSVPWKSPLEKPTARLPRSVDG